MEQGYSIPVYIVNSCPQNKADWDFRSRQLNCSNDDTKIDRYHCVPNGQKTALLEFCYDAVRPLVQKGNCMELERSTTLNQHSCNNFRSGCPEEYYYSDEAYHYPACSKIDFIGKCYVADPGCTYFKSTSSASFTEVIISTSTSMSENLTCPHWESNLSSTCTIVSTILILLIVFSCLGNLVLLKRKWLKEKYRIWREGRSKQGPTNYGKFREEKSLLPSPGAETNTIEEHELVGQNSYEMNLIEEHGLVGQNSYERKGDSEFVYVGKNPNDQQVVTARFETTQEYTERRKGGDLTHEEKKIKKTRVGASIELGTTNSGCCYSFYEQFLDNPVGSISFITWNSSIGDTLRIATEILVDENLKCRTFGYDAKLDYMEQVEENREKIYYFSNFMKNLSEYFQSNDRSSNYNLHDARQKVFDAKEIVAEAIEHMKGEILLDIEKRTGLKKENIDMFWVLTVSSLWNNKGKQFLCDCATKAGISRHSLLIVTEADSLAMYSRYLDIWKSDTKDLLKCGKEVMVLDIGGSVMNVTTYEIDFNGSLKLLKDHSIAFGGNNVDEEFKKLLMDIVGGENLGEYEKQSTSDYHEFFRDFEIKKRCGEGNTAIRIRIPSSFLQFCEEHKRKINESLIKTYGESIKCFKDTLVLKLDRPEFEQLFQSTVKRIIHEIDKIYKKYSGIELILVVGGFSNSYLLQKRMNETFAKNCRILFEKNPEIAVLRGSVLYSHQHHVYQMVRKGIIE